MRSGGKVGLSCSHSYFHFDTCTETLPVIITSAIATAGIKMEIAMTATKTHFPSTAHYPVFQIVQKSAFKPDNALS